MYSKRRRKLYRIWEKKEVLNFVGVLVRKDLELLMWSLGLLYCLTPLSLAESFWLSRHCRLLCKTTTTSSELQLDEDGRAWTTSHTSKTSSGSCCFGRAREHWGRSRLLVNRSCGIRCVHFAAICTSTARVRACRPKSIQKFKKVWALTPPRSWF